MPKTTRRRSSAATMAQIRGAMQIEIRARHIDVTAALRTHIERRLTFALGRFAERIGRVRVMLDDMNGPRGGIDKRCRITIRVVPTGTVVMEDQDSNVYTAIDRVAGKAGTCVGRQLKRPRENGPPGSFSEPGSFDKENCGMSRVAAEEIEAMKGPRKRILVADCHEEVLITLEKMLEDAGFETTSVWTAREAMKLLESRAFDLVLINEYLPDAECEEILKVLHQRAARIPCIVMQPSAPEITDFTALEALGAREVVCKYGYRHIVEVVSECLVCDKKTSLVA
jgi:putative sigma-54 modulation protein